MPRGSDSTRAAPPGEAPGDDDATTRQGEEGGPPKEAVDALFDVLEMAGAHPTLHGVPVTRDDIRALAARKARAFMDALTAEEGGSPDWSSRPMVDGPPVCVLTDGMGISSGYAAHVPGPAVMLHTPDRGTAVEACVCRRCGLVYCDPS